MIMQSNPKVNNNLPFKQEDMNSITINMNHDKDIGIEWSQKVKRLELLITSFCSLLSSACTNGVQHTLLSSDNSKLSLSAQLSSYAKNVSSPEGFYCEAFCSLPTFRLKSASSSGNRRLNNISLHEVMALNLAASFNADKASIDSVPTVLLENICNSFRDLITSRLRVSIKAIYRTVIKLGSESSEARVLRRLLTTLNPVRISTVVTSFHIVKKEDNLSDEKNGNLIVRPLTFEAIFDLCILGKMYTVAIETPGTFTASLNPIDRLLQKAHIAFDTMACLKAMMSQARAIVKKTIKRATTITSTVTTYQEQKPSSEEQCQSAESTQVKSEPSTQNNLLESYPEHLRETVQHFLRPDDRAPEVSIEGFPPNLLNTLKSLSGDNSRSESSSPTLEAPNMHQGLFSWIQNEDIVLKDKRSLQKHPRDDHFNGSPSEEINNYPNYDYECMQQLSKRAKKVSFMLPK